MTKPFRGNVQAAVKTGRRNGPTQSEADRTDNQRGAPDERTRDMKARSMWTFWFITDVAER